MEQINFIYSNDFAPASTVLEMAVTDEEGIVFLADVAEAFANFLRQAGYEYVTGVSIHKTGGESIEG